MRKIKFENILISTKNSYSHYLDRYNKVIIIFNVPFISFLGYVCLAIISGFKLNSWVTD